MDDALLVRGFQRVRHLSGNAQRLVQRKRSAREPLREILSLDELHHEGAHATGFLETVDVRDIGVVQRREGMGFACEARQPIGIAGEGVRKDLQRDVAIEPCVTGPEHLAHAAFPNPADDFVDPDTGACGKRHRVASTSARL